MDTSSKSLHRDRINCIDYNPANGLGWSIQMTKRIHIETVQEVIVALQNRVVYQDTQLNEQQKIINRQLNDIMDLHDALAKEREKNANQK
jgi:hypothetical protein